MGRKSRAARARIQNLNLIQNRRKERSLSEQGDLPERDSDPSQYPDTTTEILGDSDSSSDTTGSEIVELSALDQFCSIFWKAWDTAIQAGVTPGQNSTRPKTYTGKSKRTLSRHQREQRLKAIGSQHITDFFQPTRTDPNCVLPIQHEDEELSSSGSDGRDLKELTPRAPHKHTSTGSTHTPRYRATEEVEESSATDNENQDESLSSDELEEITSADIRNVEEGSMVTNHTSRTPGQTFGMDRHQTSMSL
ncbi:hypothetical protein BJY52DRAFT_1229306 [Lactarius psammicola]|nr:hypothetical protein BJY52DRAFT_1229306 [Lactarius psammicola]